MLIMVWGFPGGSVGKEFAYNVGDLDSIPGLGRPIGEGNGYPLSILAWRTLWTEGPGGGGLAKRQTRLSDLLSQSGLTQCCE